MYISKIQPFDNNNELIVGFILKMYTFNTLPMDIKTRLFVVVSGFGAVKLYYSGCACVG